ncbi:NYN domain-containing protein [Cellulomonas sp.]|uniref:NYN domain-containing protein n=1 Tax=Cellulomonas sp. TaxID=40001 RepID=UPI002587CC71|nr:NYN domain-containing protein [Cellulomonas sp.]MCR6688103.1 NYN domain-containing protein [Cellulomonas sp.]
MAQTVGVFIDYQNCHHSGHERYCSQGEEVFRCLVHPLKLAERIIAKRAPGGDLKEVRVYRGRPDPRKEPTLAAANDRQAQAWSDSDPRVIVKRRPLMYPPDWFPGSPDRPREKGVDVALAIDVVRMAYEKAFEVVIVVSRDTDLIPPIEMLRDLKLAHVEIAGWDGSSRIRVSGGRRLWYHELDEEDFVAVRDTRVYIPPVR